MNQKRALMKNTIIITIGKFSTKVVSFLLLPLYTSLLSTGEYGQYDLLNMISIFLIPLITLQLDEGIFRFLIDAKTNEDKSKVFSQALGFSLLSVIFWMVIIYIFGIFLNYQYTVWLMVYCIGSVIYSITSGFARGEGNFKLYSLLAFLSSVVNILLNILFIAVFRWGIEGLFLAYTLSSAIIGIYGLIRLKAYKYLNFKEYDKKLMKEMIKYSFPLVPNNISWSLISLTDRLLLVGKLGDSANGIYSVGNKFPTIITTCFGFFNTSWRESASRNVEAENHKEFYTSVYISLNRFLLGVSMCLICLMPFAFPLLVNAKFSESYLYIPLLTISSYFANISSYSSGIFSAYKDNKILAPTTMVAALLNLIIDILLIKHIKIFAPVIGTLIAYFLINEYRNYKLRKYLVLPKDKERYRVILMFILLISIYYSKILILQVIGGVVGVYYAYYLNKDFLSRFFTKRTFGFIIRFIDRIKRRFVKNG